MLAQCICTSLFCLYPAEQGHASKSRIKRERRGILAQLEMRGSEIKLIMW
jgi:hypothetical protein